VLKVLISEAETKTATSVPPHPIYNLIGPTVFA
jgi:hypothetical protein